MGGGILSPKVREAMDVDCSYDMEELDRWAGEQIRRITKTEDATVCSGAYAGLVQSAAALIRGIRNRFTVQKLLRTPYDSALEVAGGKIVQDSMDGYYAAGIHFLAGGQGPWWSGTQPWMLWQASPTPLQDIQTYASRHGVPLLVDAAGQSFPLDGFTRYRECELSVYAGKYFGAPMSTGFVSGQRELVEKARMQGPIGFEKGLKAVGRGHKVDASEVLGMVAALKEWVYLDHWKARAEPAYAKAKTIQDMLSTKETALIPEEKQRIIPYHRILLTVSAHEPFKVQSQLAQGEPSIRADVIDNRLALNMLTLREGEEVEVAEKLKPLL